MDYDVKRFKSELIKLLNNIKIYSDEKSFNEGLNRLILFIKENNINTDILGEVLGGFIIERCDNMLANLLAENAYSSIREAVHKMALEALKLYMYSVTKQAFLNKEIFVKFILDIKEPLRIEADNKRDLERKVLEKILRLATKTLRDEGLQLAQIVVVEDKEEFEKLAPLISYALESKALKLIIIPNTDPASKPLFFKEYYQPSHSDLNKVGKVALALTQIIGALKGYFELDDYALQHLRRIEQKARSVMNSLKTTRNKEESNPEFLLLPLDILFRPKLNFNTRVKMTDELLKRIDEYETSHSS